MKSLRSKLAVSLIGVCITVILVIWIALAISFGPMYHTATQLELAQTLNKTIDAIEENDYALNDEVIEEISAFMSQGVCIEIANETGSGLVLLEGIGDACQLHGSKDEYNDSYYEQQQRLNTTNSIQLRETVRDVNTYNGSMVDDYGNTQIVRGQFVEGLYTVIVSTNLARTNSIVSIVSNQLQAVTIFAVFLAFIMSAIIANNFIKPISVLSKATKEITKGNYRVKLVTQEGKDDEIVQLAKDFNTMIEEIESTQYMQKELIASISHDLRTPLTIIKGYAESIKDITGDNKEMRENQLETIIDETDRLSQMVGSVLEYAKLNQKTNKLNIVQYDIVEMALDVIEVYSHRAQNEEKQILYKGVDSAFVFADAALIERVLHNFVSNALLHTQKGDSVYIEVGVMEDNRIKVSVNDTGEGILEEDIKYIFDRYYRSRKDTGKQGTGLGLAIVKSILENHNFEFGVDSKLSEGSKFWFIM